MVSHLNQDSPPSKPQRPYTFASRAANKKVKQRKAQRRGPRHRHISQQKQSRNMTATAAGAQHSQERMTNAGECLDSKLSVQAPAGAAAQPLPAHFYCAMATISHSPYHKTHHVQEELCNALGQLRASATHPWIDMLTWQHDLPGVKPAKRFGVPWVNLTQEAFMATKQQAPLHELQRTQIKRAPPKPSQPLLQAAASPGESVEDAGHFEVDLCFPMLLSLQCTASSTVTSNLIVQSCVSN